VPSYGSSHFTGTLVQRLSLVRRILGKEALIGQEISWHRLRLGRRYLGTEALIGQEVPWCRGSNWAGGTLVQRL
jgi:hypothetical protein